MPAPPDLVHYTITGAQDWPMFKEMLAGMRILFLLLWGTIGAGLGFMWRDLKKRISSQRAEDQVHCVECKKRQREEYKYIWDAIDCCCPRSQEAKAAIIAAKARIDSGGVLPVEAL